MLATTSFIPFVRGLTLALALATTNGCGVTRPATTNEADARDSGTVDTTQPSADTVGDDRFDTGVGDDRFDTGVDADGGDSPSCVRVTGGGLEPWLDLHVVGRQFDAYEGRRIRVLVGSHPAGRLGVGEATIANGAFEITIPAAINNSYYTEIALYVDDDADDTCDAGEPLWGFVTGIVRENLVVDATPDELCVSGGGPSVGAGCRPWPMPAGPSCFINGQVDLEMRLPCPPQKL